MTTRGYTDNQFYGHSMVYHPDTDSIYVFGGYRHLYNKVMAVTKVVGLRASLQVLES